MFALDRDLLAVEPTVFRDVQWLGQRLCAGTGTISGTTLTLSGLDVALDAAGVTAGHVVTIDGVSFEVVARLGPSSATVSKLRVSASDPAIPPGNVSGRPAAVFTFAPQIGLVHGHLARMLGLGESGLDESAVKNPEELAHAEALGALHLVYASASALSGPDSPLGRRARWYQERFGIERRSVVAQVDTDGDGVADALRRLNVLQLVR